jgi:hypothetical protein
LVAYTNFKLGKGPNPSELSSKVAPVKLPGMQTTQAMVGLFGHFGKVGNSDCGIGIDPDNKMAKYHQGKVTLSADYSHEVEQRFGYGAKPEQVTELIKSELQSNKLPEKSQIETKRRSQGATTDATKAQIVFL